MLHENLSQTQKQPQGRVVLFFADSPLVPSILSQLPLNSTDQLVIASNSHSHYDLNACAGESISEDFDEDVEMDTDEGTIHRPLPRRGGWDWRPTDFGLPTPPMARTPSPVSAMHTSHCLGFEPEGYGYYAMETPYELAEVGLPSTRRAKRPREEESEAGQGVPVQGRRKAVMRATTSQLQQAQQQHASPMPPSLNIKCNLLEDIESVHTAFKYTVEKFGRVDVILNSHGARIGQDIQLVRSWHALVAQAESCRNSITFVNISSQNHGLSPYTSTSLQSISEQLTRIGCSLSSIELSF